MFSKKEGVCIHDLGNLTLQMIFDGWLASMIDGSKRPVAWNNSRHVRLWRCYLHCGIEETGSRGIICIVCHQVMCHPSPYAISSIATHLLATAHIAKLNKSTESKVNELNSSMVDETPLAILKRQESRGIPMVSSQSKFIFNTSISSIFTELTDKTLKTISKGVSNGRISPRHL